MRFILALSFLLAFVLCYAYAASVEDKSTQQVLFKGDPSANKGRSGGKFQWKVLLTLVQNIFNIHSF